MQQLKMAMPAISYIGSLTLPMVEKTPPPYPVFGYQVDRAMRRAGLGVGDIAKALGVTPEMARRYQNGLAMPRDTKLRQLAALLGVPPAQLQYGAIDAKEAPGLFEANVVLTPDEISLIDAYRQLPEFARKALRSRATELLESFGAAGKNNPFGQGDGTQ